LTELLPLAADRRSHPGDDLLSFIDADPDLELDDVVITAVIIAIAGHETTANLLGAAMIRLLTPRLDGVRPIDAIDAIDDRLITELLRLDGPVQAVGRTAPHDHVLNDITIHAGEPVLVVLPPPTAIRPFSTGPANSKQPAPGLPRSHSAMARTTASVRRSPASRSPERSNTSWRAGPHSAGRRDMAGHSSHPRTPDASLRLRHPTNLPEATISNR
jgi:hypothetical protein